MATTPSNEASSPERLANAYLRLSKSANSLNAASDALGRAIAASDEQLRSLNLGVSAWIIVTQDSNDESEKLLAEIARLRQGRREVGHRAEG